MVFAPPSRRDGAAPLDPAPNTLVFRVQPDEGIELHIGMKEPGAGSVVRQVSLSVDFDSMFDPAPEAYERLIHDVLCGDSTLFPRREEIEQSWRVIDPLLHY
ncbi:hypothetical protein [Nocardia sp. CA-135398]|uniref:hypothetical protein n=1 Tax=Nocardia sp. CA-135398 TaxID=3239977 RepID=UPI003D964AB9